MPAAKVEHHVVQAPERGKRYGNPANTGLMFHWARPGKPDELLFGAYEARYAFPDPKTGKPNGHNTNIYEPQWIDLWRSKDGGDNWKKEWHDELQPFENKAGFNGPLKPPKECALLPGNGIPFDAPGLAIIVRTTRNSENTNEGFDLDEPVTGRRSYLTYSTDEGHHWSDRYWFPMQPMVKTGPYNESWLSRTDYRVLGPSNAQFFVVVDPFIDGKIQITTAKIETWDGGKTYPVDRGMTTLGKPDPPRFDNKLFGKSMPSTVAIPGTQILLSAVRGVNESKKQPGKRNQWIRIYRSLDGGKTFGNDPISSIVEWEDPISSNPPSMVVLADGRVACIYGHREKPYSLRAVISADRGITWGEPIILRSGASWDDVGYPRAAVLSDGRVAIGYYWNADGPLGKGREAYTSIECTLWTP